MNYQILIKLIILSLIISFYSCETDSKIDMDPTLPLFEEIGSLKSGIKFKNVIHETAKNNLLTNNYLYSGGGVSVGDINNDGLQDLLFISNESNAALYLNKGNFKFEDITTKSGISTLKGWTTGSNFVDINNDGFMDIYICKGGEFFDDPSLKHNLLFINNGDLTFTEKAKEYGLDDDGTSTQAAFFDYDKDGDLDVYVLNIPAMQPKTTIPQIRDFRYNPVPPYDKYSDHLYKNLGNGKFQDVTKEAKIQNYGYGLGIAIADIDDDNWPDVYITNDFEQQDYFWRNNYNGTFGDRLPQTMGHNSYFAMGCDIGDIDNDGFVDIFEVEMAPKDRSRSVENMESMNRNKFETMVNLGLVPQYMRNCLHLNRGYGYKFTEIAQFAGVNKTDWSWGTLIVDLDDDGYKDIFVANGIAKDVKNRDFARKGNKIAAQQGGSLTPEEVTALSPSTPIRNYAFKNNGDLTFADNSIEWGFDFKGFSNGLSYADLDNDGDLDLILNNLNEYPLLYKNTSTERGNNYLNITFKGGDNNKNGIGAKAKIITKKGIQYQEMYPVHGFQSTSQYIVHFGLGNEESIDTLIITWPNDAMQTLTNVKVNQNLIVDIQNAKEKYIIGAKLHPIVRGGSKRTMINSKQIEINYDDFAKEILLPHKLSQMGPFAGVGDLNGDKKGDLYIGGSAEYPGELYTSTSTILYTKRDLSILKKDKAYEDMGSVFFDADGDGDLDLYVVSGSNQFKIGSSKYQDRLYLNDGDGNLTRSNGLPRETESGSCVIAADFDKDGDQDLFVGGRIKPGNYPYSSKSFILENNKGKFTNITNKVAPGLEDIGMVTSAVWSDFDKDGDDDLFVVGEWLSIHVFKNENGKFKDISNTLGLENTSGWWNKIIEWDFDKDGDMDYVVGNIGLNHKFKASPEKPFQVFANDFDDNGNLDIVLAYNSKNATFPVRGRDCTSEQMPFITEKFPTFKSFGTAKITDMFDDEKLKSALHYEAQLFASVILENTGNGFKIKPLPTKAQFSAINGLLPFDIDDDGDEDLLLVGNMYQTEAETSRADGNMGLILENKNGTFEAQELIDNGFFSPGDAKDLKYMKNDMPIFIITNNNNKVQVYMKPSKQDLKR